MTFKEEKVSLATFWLFDNAKLWWRTHQEDIVNGRVTINTWEDLKRELKNPFIPENAEFIASSCLTPLGASNKRAQSESTWNTALMLDIKGISEKDKLSHFLEGLKPWAQQELIRRGVKDLASAQAAAERLVLKRPN